ncbi:MAG: hypothetical protein J3K34DRAFT_64613 [Monoraphidium minutum]|nr:MAG: hypothetical protein J3K34DRAFT_64613 [Monoraphidium minutum]
MKHEADDEGAPRHELPRGERPRARPVPARAQAASVKREPRAGAFVPLGAIAACVVGTQYSDDELLPGEPARLVREAWNGGDSNAVAVLTPRDLRCGYLSRHLSALLAPLLDASVVRLAAAAPRHGDCEREFSDYFTPLDIAVLWAPDVGGGELWELLEAELQRFTPDGMMVRRRGMWKFAFGKHSGLRVADMAQDDPSYINWLLNNRTMSRAVKRRVLATLASAARQEARAAAAARQARRGAAAAAAAQAASKRRRVAA